MNKTLLSAVLAVAALSPFAAKADEANQLNNFFVTGNLGQSNYRVGGLTDKSDVFQSVRFGWRWNNIVGAEAGFTSLGQGKYSANNVTVGVQPKAVILGVNAKYDFYGPWFVSGHAGYLRSRTTGSVTYGDSRMTEKSWNNGWYGGVGVGYNVTENVALAINYDNYHVKYGRGGSNQPQTNANVAAYSASVEYRF
ncbi:outer membrane beta-barrel protein [Dyella subtropica]|uniref:outer membrane beta-barrel protein n=1 Tax=Dyella subtropica TaxID=2992127 RepID=UPI002257E807|nr:outer membrane beta-barrel protein [Dyella subtropica]